MECRNCFHDSGKYLGNIRESDTDKYILGVPAEFVRLACRYATPSRTNAGSQIFKKLYKSEDACATRNVTYSHANHALHQNPVCAVLRRLCTSTLGACKWTAALQLVVISAAPNYSIGDKWSFQAVLAF